MPLIITMPMAWRYKAAIEDLLFCTCATEAKRNTALSSPRRATVAPIVTMVRARKNTPVSEVPNNRANITLNKKARPVPATLAINAAATPSVLRFASLDFCWAFSLVMGFTWVFDLFSLAFYIL